MVDVLARLRRLLSRRFGSGVAGGGVLVLLGASVAVASIPDSSGVIHGCYKTANGQLRIIDTASDSCRPSETAISWNQTGAQGPPGQPGPAGGLSSIQEVTSGTSFNVPAGVSRLMLEAWGGGGGGAASVSRPA